MKSKSDLKMLKITIKFPSIYILAGEPGTGKSQFLDELERLTKEYINKDEKSKSLLKYDFSKRYIW